MATTIQEVKEIIERETPKQNGYVFVTFDRKGEITMSYRAMHPEGDDAYRAMAALLVRHPKGAQFLEQMAVEAGS